MAYSRYTGLIFFVFLAVARLALAAEDLLPQEQAYRLTSKAASADRLLLSWDIADGYYLYRSKFKFASKTSGVSLGEAIFPQGENKHDEFFGDMEIYRGHIDISVPLKREDTSVSQVDLEVVSQGCADQGICYPPFKQSLTLSLPESAAEASAKENPLAKLSQSFNKVGLSSQQDGLLPPDQAFHFIGEVKDATTLRVSWQIAEGYYLYRERFSFALLDGRGVDLGSPDIPHGRVKEEEEGPMEVFHEEVGFDLPLQRTQREAVTIRLQAKYQGCAEKGVCYPPMQKTVELELPAGAGSTPPQSQKIERPATIVAEQDRIADSLKHDSLWLVALSFLGFGVLMAFSPCIFPMIPILSGIIVGHGHVISTSRALMLSLSYVLAASLAYTVFGVLAGLFGGNLQAWFQDPRIIALFSTLFLVLALSMFGLYELQVPGFIQERVTSLSQKQKGGTLFGAAVMGALSALIVGPCMAAPLAGALIYIGQTGDALMGGVALFSMGLGMGVPLLVIGASAGKLLPKAGIWMNTVKAIFGVVMLAMAVWLLDRILPPAVTLFLWALLLIIPAIFLGALDALPHQASGWRKLWKGVGVAMLAYGVLLLIGVATNSTDPLQPLRTAGAAAACEKQAGLTFKKVSSRAQLQQQLSEAKTQGRWVMLDYYADWCVSCKEMERYTFTDPKVVATLANVVLLQADVTANNEEDTELLSGFGLIGPPATLFFSPEGSEQKNVRVIGFMDAEKFVTHLHRFLR